jgi:hypothetical protein
MIKKYWIFVFEIGLIILIVSTFLPLLQNVGQSWLSLLRQLSEHDFPPIHLDKDGISIEGDLPQTIILKDSVTWLFTRNVDPRFLDDVPPKSAILSDTLFLYKTPSDVKTFSLDQVQADEPQYLNRQRLLRVINFIETDLILIVILAVGALIFLILNIIALFGAGAGAMLDGFTFGTLSFSSMFLTSLILLAFGFLVGTMVIQQQIDFKWTLYGGLFIFLLLNMCLTLLRSYRIHRKRQMN